MGLLDILGRMSGGVRNTVQRIPGGSDAFPTEANGTVNWVGNPLRGDNVLGSMFRGATGIDAAESAGNFIFGGRNKPQDGVTSPAGNFARDRDRISRAAQSGAGSRPGSVVARGFIGRRSELGPTARTPGATPQQGFPGDSIGLPQGGQPQRDPNWRMPGTDSPPPPASAAGGPGGGGGPGGSGRVNGTQIARLGLLSQQQGGLLSADAHSEIIRTRGGTQAER